MNSRLDALLHDAERLEEHGDLFQPRRYRDEIFGPLDVFLRHVPVHPLDAPLQVVACQAHVLVVVPALETPLRAGPAHRSHDEVAFAVARDVFRLSGHPAEVLVPDNQIVAAFRRLADEAGKKFLVRAANPGLQHFYKYFSLTGPGVGYVDDVQAVFYPWRYYSGLHKYHRVHRGHRGHS